MTCPSRGCSLPFDSPATRTPEVTGPTPTLTGSEQGLLAHIAPPEKSGGANGSTARQVWAIQTRQGHSTQLRFDVQ